MALWGLASEMLRGLGRMSGYASVQQGVLTALAVALMLSLGLNVVSAFGAALLVVAVAAVAQVAWSLPTGSKAIDMPASYRRSAMLSTAWPMLLGSAMFLVMSWTDTLLLGHFLDESEVGVYRVAFRLAAVITLVQAAVNSYAAPWFAERHAVGDDAGLRRALAQTTGLNVAFSVPAFLALAVAPAWWLGWFGPAFESGAMCLLCLALGQLVNALCGPVMYLLNMTGHERVAQRIVWVAALLNLALNLWAIPRFGILGAAASTAATMVLWNVAAAVAVQRQLGLSVWTVLRSFAQRNKA
jgi:O-antigen/teichoic acid export membrane protein